MASCRTGYSTKLDLIFLTDKINEAINAGKLVGGLLMDRSKTFDSINHIILFKTLNMIGVTGPALALIRSCLLNRKPTVCISGTYPNFQAANIGAPQGSLLGPLLFIIYANDLPQCLNSSTLVLYADDTTILTSDTRLGSLVTKLNADAANVVNWCRMNMLTINESESSFVIFSSRQKVISGNPFYSEAING